MQWFYIYNFIRTPVKKKMANKKKQKNTRVVTPRNKPAKPAWIKSIPKKVIPVSTGVKQNKPQGFVKVI